MYKRQVYIPYFVAVNNQVPVHFCVTPVTLLADKLIVQSEPEMCIRDR